ncbi:MAG: helix-turn-helix domain-containing protein [Bacillota bacterium]|jgi:HTH-type transcriptional repressor of puuD
MKIGTRIRELREALGYTITNFAKIVGISRIYLSELERNVKEPSLDTLRRICQALGITLAEFFATDKPDIPPDLRRLLDTAKELSPKQREALQHLLDTMKFDDNS